MLRFVLGKSGTGKTTLIYNKICELIREGNEKIIMLVPDQSSFETEKAFLDILGAKNCKKVLVFGFSRLCKYVFDKTAFVSKNVIDNGTRAVFMSLALEQLTEKLRLLHSKNNKSMVDVMLSTVTDLKKNSVTSDMLRAGASNIKDETLKTKLIETALISDTFDALVSQSYIDPLDDLTRLNNILSENNIFSAYTIFIDGFSGFTVQQLKSVRLLINQCRDTYISLSLDPFSNGKEDVFATSQHTYKIIKDFAKRDGIDIKAPIKTKESLRFKSDELKTLENGIFRNNYSACLDAPKNIMLYSALDTYEECEFVARQIKKHVINNGYLYKDFSVICHETTAYNGIIDEVFEKYDIPYFMDRKTDIEVKPVIRFVSSLFRVALDNFERDDVMSLLKTGLTYNSTDDISIFENYVFVWNINHSDFKREFTQNPKGFSEKFTENDKKTLDIAEKVRKSISEPLLEFKSKSKDKNGRQLTAMLYDLLCELGVLEALGKMYDKFESTSNKSIGAEQIKIWNMLMDILDKMVAVTGDMSLSLGRFYELLYMHISEMQLSQIPQTIDSVIITTAQRVRISNHRASFLIGCIDGVFPAAPHATGIFSSFELKLLAVNEIALGDDFSDLASLETFMAYCCMTSPSHKLFLSYPIADSQGKTNIPSAIFTETEKIFPNITRTDIFEFDSKKDSMLALKPAFEIFSKSLSNSYNGLGGLLDYFCSFDSYNSKLEAIDRAKNKAPFSIKHIDNAEKLFGESLKISASQIEKFNMCRFSYFCNYGLNIKERRKAEINPMEYGTLVHYILEQFFTKYSKSEYSLMKYAEISEFVNEVISGYLNNYFGGEESKTGSFMYRLETLKSNICILLEHIVAEMIQSDFDVADCELKIGDDIPAYTIKLPDSHKISVYGSVDRVDVMERDGIRYLRVIDYKTGSKKFKLSDILYGLNLQMLLYLCSIKRNGSDRYGEIIPSGILYMPATVPVISADKNTENETIYSKINKELTMNGLLLDDLNSIRGMDKTDSGRYIPVKVKLDMPVSARSLASLEDFGKIFSKIDMIIASMGKDLYGGNIMAAPVKGGHDACEYCPYDSVCAYRRSKPINTFDIDNEEVLKQITDELSQKGENE